MAPALLQNHGVMLQDLYFRPPLLFFNHRGHGIFAKMLCALCGFFNHRGHGESLQIVLVLSVVF